MSTTCFISTLAVFPFRPTITFVALRFQLFTSTLRRLPSQNNIGDIDSHSDVLLARITPIQFFPTRLAHADKRLQIQILRGIQSHEPELIFSSPRKFEENPQKLDVAGARIEHILCCQQTVRSRHRVQLLTKSFISFCRLDTHKLWRVFERSPQDSVGHKLSWWPTPAAPTNLA